MTDLHPKRLSLAALPSEELRTLLRESGDPDVLLAAAELLQERGDSAFLPPDTENYTKNRDERQWGEIF